MVCAMLVEVEALQEHLIHHRSCPILGKQSWQDKLQRLEVYKTSRLMSPRFGLAEPKACALSETWLLSCRGRITSRNRMGRTCSLLYPKLIGL